MIDEYVRAKLVKAVQDRVILYSLFPPTLVRVPLYQRLWNQWVRWPVNRLLHRLGGCCDGWCDEE